MDWRKFTAALAILLAVSALPARAAILASTSQRNTSAPTGTLKDSGWDYQGQWGAYLGTPIAPQYFLTAGHIGRSVGQAFIYQGRSYTTTAMYDDPNSDLRLWKVSGQFSSFARLYTAHTEVGAGMTVFGRGTQRGAEVRKNGDLKGWLWGSNDKVQAWGQNTVDSIANGNAGRGDLLKFDFDLHGVANEGFVTLGDSGGGVFIKDHQVWRLAGIVNSVDNPFSLTGQVGTGFQAAIVDKRMIYSGGESNWTFNPDGSAALPASAYATRISSNMTWINSVVGNTIPPGANGNQLPEPSATASLVLVTWLLGSRSIRINR